MFALVEFRKWPPEWIENLIPFEKHIYLDMLAKYTKQQEEHARDLQAARRNK